MKEVYYSVDIEADGPIPGPYSMLSFALCVVGEYDGESFTPQRVDREVFYRELRPISDQFNEDNLKATGFSHEYLHEHGAEPKSAMLAAKRFVEETARGRKPVFVAYPLSYDWMWVYWYFMNFTGSSPFGFSSCLDMKTMFQTKSANPLFRSTKRFMPKELHSSRRHTHRADDDAMEQGELFQNLFRWRGYG